MKKKKQKKKKQNEVLPSVIQNYKVEIIPAASFNQIRFLLFFKPPVQKEKLRE